MVSHILVEEPAQDDLEQIFLYIQKISPFVAGQFLDEVFKAIQSLSDFPKKHPVLMVMRGFEIRQLVFKKTLRIFYTIKAQEVHILHCYRCEREIKEEIF